MIRTDFLSLLARAARDGTITEAQAIDLLRRFDAGELEIDEDAVSLPPEMFVRPADEGEIRRAIIALLAIGALSLLHRRVRQMRETLQDSFQIRGATLARRYGESGNLRVWQEAFRGAVVTNIVQQRAVGSGRVPTVAQVARATVEQSAFVSRWADGMALKTLMGEPPSYFQMAARSILYGGAGRAEGYRAEEEDVETGYVIDYESADDGGTCAPCLEAEANGPYLPSEGPMPGEVCEGYGNCRCRRVMRFAPQEFAVLRRAA